MIEAVLAFAICAAARLEDADGCEAGHVTGRSCQVAETFVRAGLQPGQVLEVFGCDVRPVVAAAR